MKKEKIFYINQTGIKIVLIVLGILTLLIIFALVPSNSVVNSLAKKILFEIEQKFILAILLTLGFMSLFLFDRFIITEDKYIYQRLFSSQEYSKRTHRIVGRGAKEEYSHGAGDDGNSTEYWKQIDILNKNGALVLALKVRCSQNYYEKMISYLKIDEWNECIVDLQTENQKAIHFELEPSQAVSKKQLHPSELFALVTGGLAGGMIYHFVFQGLLSQGWALLFILVGIGISSLKIVDFNRYQELNRLVVTMNGLKINEKVIQETAISSLKMSSSEDDNHSDGLAFLFITFNDNGKKRTLRYEFTISIYERIVYREIEEYFTQAYGKQGKFQLLYAKKQEQSF